MTVVQSCLCVLCLPHAYSYLSRDPLPYPRYPRSGSHAMVPGKGGRGPARAPGGAGAPGAHGKRLVKRGEARIGGGYGGSDQECLLGKCSLKDKNCVDCQPSANSSKVRPIYGL